MRFCAGLRPDVPRPVWHCSLRAAPEDPVFDDAGWARIAAMGLTGCSWVVVRHDVGHVHIVAGPVNAYGRVWRYNMDYVRAMRTVRAIEREHGLVVVDGPARSAGALGVRAQSQA